MEGQSLYGKYRGIVSDNQDPAGRGRLRLRVPDVFGQHESGWAEPCLPLAGQRMGWFAVPPVNTPVWVEFECGDPEYPIWSGCRWQTQQDVPSLPSSAKQKPDSVIAICTVGNQQLILDDSSQGGIRLVTSSGQKLVISSQGIEIDNGQGASIKLTKNQVSINGGALEVT